VQRRWRLVADTPRTEELQPEDRSRPEASLQRRDLVRSFWRYFWTFQISWNYERMQALGFAYSIEPVLRRLYPDDFEYRAALERHLVFFNTNPIVGAPLIVGSAAALEEAGAPQSAEGVKVALMGPLAGVGDTLVFALYNSIIFTIGSSLALDGNILGPILVGLFVAVPYFAVRWWQFFWAYQQGKQIATRMAAGALDRITEGATVLGLIVLGGFIPSIVNITTTLTYKQTVTVPGEEDPVTQEVKVQDQLDAILPFLIPVAVTAFVYFLLKRYNLNPLWAIAILAVIAIPLGWAGWFAPAGG
jgi:mannose/fructose/N-acetylgalactosamine-specific phosphotransferase system component IID